MNLVNLTAVGQVPELNIIGETKPASRTTILCNKQLRYSARILAGHLKYSKRAADYQTSSFKVQKNIFKLMFGHHSIENVTTELWRIAICDKLNFDGQLCGEDFAVLISKDGEIQLVPNQIFESSVTAVAIVSKIFDIDSALRLRNELERQVFVR